MSIKIALVEDDEIIRNNYSEILADEGFEVVVFSNRQEAMNYFQTALPDIAILDVGLQEERDGGFKLCSDLRRLAPKLPIIFLTSRDDEIDRISGLRLGADDYITKDASINFIMVRIEALFHRIEVITQSEPSELKIEQNHSEFGLLRLDKKLLKAAWKNTPLDLSLTQFWILCELVTNPGEVKTCDKLMHAAHICVEPNTITAHIKMIRSRFRDIDNEFDCIKTERSAGYRWLDKNSDID
ncbi:response regulator [Methyloglobulus sp.]|uniref:response regulator n=1 Tax=Methyloglobulus sp. TaxID=2518622 RepID=UPI0032B70433